MKSGGKQIKLFLDPSKNKQEPQYVFRTDGNRPAFVSQNCVYILTSDTQLLLHDSRV